MLYILALFLFDMEYQREYFKVLLYTFVKMKKISNAEFSVEVIVRYTSRYLCYNYTYKKF